MGPIAKLDGELLSDDLVAKIETALSTGRDSLDDWLVPETERPGLWPDQLRDDPLDPGEDSVDDEGNVTGETRQPVNRIFYGPPGTGKTYELSKLLKREYEQAMTSLSVAQWREQLIATRIANLTWWEGAAAALHDLGGEAKVAQLYEHPFIQAIAAAKGRTDNIKQTLWGTLQHHTIEGSKNVNTKLSRCRCSSSSGRRGCGSGCCRSVSHRGGWQSRTVRLSSMLSQASALQRPSMLGCHPWVDRSGADGTAQSDRR